QVTSTTNGQANASGVNTNQQPAQGPFQF
ncbi:unnamed protein product, partial [Rotaria magnacalcarata]